MFCATEITQFSMVRSFMESHFGTADKWDVYGDSFMTNKLFFLLLHTPECLEASDIAV